MWDRVGYLLLLLCLILIIPKQIIRLFDPRYRSVPALKAEARRVLIVLAVAGTALYILWQWLDPTVTVRYRVTLHVLMNNKENIGAAVWEVTSHNNWILLEGGPWTPQITGEAVAVDLGEQGILVASLISDRTRPSSTMPDSLMALATGPFPDGGFVSDSLWEINLRGDIVIVPLERLPMLVHFKDRSDPRTVERVDLANLEKTFGRSVHLLYATIQIVPRGWWPLNLLGLRAPQWIFGQPIASDLDGLLPWLPSWKGFLLDRQKGARGCRRSTHSANIPSLEGVTFRN
jgi:hypothetical protein